MELYLSQTFLDFCLNTASSLAYHIAYDLHPSRIVMPILLLSYGLLMYYREPSDTQLQPLPIFGRHYTVDCTFGLPATYMVFSCIMYLSNYIQLLRNRYRVYTMNASLLEYSVLDALRCAFFFGYVCVLLPLREPPRQFISDGICTYGVAQSTRFGRLLRRILKFLICALVAFLTNFPISESFWNSRNHLSVQETLSQYRQHVDAWAKREDEVQRVQNEYHVFIAELEQKSLARIIDFDADAFDVPTDNCASKTSTPFLSDLYEAVAIENAVLAGVRKSKVTHIGKAKYIYVDDKGREVTIGDHNVLVCPGLPTRIVSIPNCAKQLEE
jgi:hypothetical protein